MPIASYPLPEHPPEMDTLISGTAANHSLLTGTLTNALTNAYSAVAKNGGGLTRVGNKLTRGVQAQLSAQGDGLAGVQTAANAGMAAAVARQGEVVAGLVSKTMPASSSAPASAAPITWWVCNLSGAPAACSSGTSAPPPGVQTLAGPFVTEQDATSWLKANRPATGAAAASAAPAGGCGSSSDPYAGAGTSYVFNGKCCGIRSTMPAGVDYRGPIGLPAGQTAHDGAPCGWTVWAYCSDSSPGTIAYYVTGPDPQADWTNAPFPAGSRLQGFYLDGGEVDQVIGSLLSGAPLYLPPWSVAHGGGALSCLPGSAPPPVATPPPPTTTPPAPAPPAPQPTPTEGECPPEPCYTSPVLAGYEEQVAPFEVRCQALWDALGKEPQNLIALAQQIIKFITPGAIKDEFDLFDNPSHWAKWFKDGLISLLNAWNQVGEWLTKQVLPPAGCTSDTAASAALMLAGFHVLERVTGIRLKDSITQTEYVLNSECPTFLPSQSEVDDLYKHAWINREDWRCYTAALNNLPDMRERVIRDARPWLSYQDAITLNERGIRPTVGDQPTTLVQYAVNRAGINELDTYTAILQSMRWWPSPREIMDAADNGIIGGTTITDWGIDTNWASADTAEVDAKLRGALVNSDDALTLYAMGWIPPTTARAREYLWRLRDGVDGVTEPFTLDDYNAVCALNERSDYVTEYERQLAYRALSPGEERSLYEWGVRPTSRSLDAYLSAGYSPVDAPLLAQRDDYEATRARAAATDGWTIRRVAELVRMSIVDMQQAKSLLLGQGYTDEELQTAVSVAGTEYLAHIADQATRLARRQATRAALAGFTAGTVDRPTAAAALTTAGYPEGAAQAVLSAYDAQAQAAQAKGVIESLKSAVMRGALRTDQARSILGLAGIVPERADQIERGWELELAGRHKVAALSDIKRWVKAGLLDVAEARQWVRNLGWSNPEAVLLTEEMEQSVASAAARLESSQDKAAAARARDARRAAAAAKRVQDLAVAALVKDQPLALLKKGLTSGILPAEYVRQRLTEYRYTDSAIDIILAEWLQIDLATAAQTGLGPEVTIP